MIGKKVVWVGLSTDVWNRVPLLIQRGWDISVIAGDEEILRAERSYESVIPAKTLRIPKTRHGIGELIRDVECGKVIVDEAPDIVITDGWHPISMLLAHLFSRNPPRFMMVILSLPVPDKYRFVHRAYFAATQLLAGLTKCRCSSISPVVAKEVKRLSLGMLDCSVAPPGVDDKLFVPTAIPISRKDLLVPEMAFVMMYHGVISSNRKLGFLLHVLSELRKVEPRAMLVIVGSGNGQAQLTRLSRQLGVSEHVRFIGWIPYNRLPSYISVADIEVVPLPEDLMWSTPYKILEAMACGKVVLATDIAATREIQTEAKCLLLARNDVSVWVTQVSKVVNDAPTLARLGHAGREYVETNHSWTRSVDILDAQLREGGHGTFRSETTMNEA